MLLSVTRRHTDPDTGPQTAVTEYEYGDSANPGMVTKVISAAGEHRTDARLQLRHHLHLRRLGQPGRDAHRRHRSVRAEVVRLLADQPAVASTRRKRMEPNPLGAGWALRLGELRVYYDIDEAAQRVWVSRVGVKVRERVRVGGAFVDMREQE
jgi:hypothetical protein